MTISTTIPRRRHLMAAEPKHKSKVKLLTRRKGVQKAVFRGQQRDLGDGVIKQVTLRRSDGTTVHAVKYATADKAREAAALRRLTPRVGLKRAMALVHLGRGVERTVERNRHRTPEQRRREYRETDFVDI